MTVMAMLLFAIGMFAKDIKTVVFTTLPQMHCESCETKIKGNLRFEKGIKEITTSVPDQKVTIQYDASKTTPENIIKGFAKIGYEATVVTDSVKKSGCSGCAKKADAAKKEGGCCAGKADAKKEGGCCSGKAEAKKEGGCCAGKTEAKKEGGCCGGKADAKKEGGCCGGKADAKKEGGCCGGKTEAKKEGSCSK